MTSRPIWIAVGLGCCCLPLVPRAVGEAPLAEPETVHGPELRAALLSGVQGTGQEPPLVHWYAGRIQQGGQWLSVDEAAQAMTKSLPALAKYRVLRDQAQDNVADHEFLAKWCQQHDLPKHAELHWLQVVRLAPQHRVALGQLQLVWYHGALVTREEQQRQQQRDREAAKLARQTREEARRLRRQFELGDQDQVAQARAALRQLDEPAALSAVAVEFSGGTPDDDPQEPLVQELISVLSASSDPVATRLLVDLSLSPRLASLRYLFVEQLKSKPWEELMPLLLSQLQLPVEAAVQVQGFENGVVASYTYAQEGPNGQAYEQHYDSRRGLRGSPYLAAPLFSER